MQGVCMYHSRGFFCSRHLQTRSQDNHTHIWKHTSVFAWSTATSAAASGLSWPYIMEKNEQNGASIDMHACANVHVMYLWIRGKQTQTLDVCIVPLDVFQSLFFQSSEWVRKRLHILLNQLWM